jgi:dTDP-4-amino-4,6-dideoxygalactose transaminase
VKEEARLRIPFNRPACLGGELGYVADAFSNGHISGDGPYTRRATELLERELGTRVLLTTSCTHALELAALLLNVEPGDEVIVPAFTFTSSINAFVLRGATPVFVDIRPDTLNLDEREVERRITSRTKAIVPVHYAGIACDMDRLTALASEHRIAIVEDNAHGLFGRYKGKYLGTFGSLATLSFHETKNFTCGEGGALLINDSRLHERAEILREKGTNRSRFFRGEIDKYGWVDIGSSYVLSDVLAAILFAQLQKRQEVQARRRCIWTAYADRLAEWAAARQVTLPSLPGVDVESAYHLFYLLMPSAEIRQGLIAHLRQRGILSVFHYLPLNRSPMGLKLSPAVTACPVAEDVSERLVRLPFFTTLSDSDLATVIDAVRSFEVS